MTPPGGDQYKIIIGGVFYADNYDRNVHHYVYLVKFMYKISAIMTITVIKYTFFSHNYDRKIRKISRLGTFGHNCRQRSFSVL